MEYIRKSKFKRYSKINSFEDIYLQPNNLWLINSNISEIMIMKIRNYCIYENCFDNKSFKRHIYNEIKSKKNYLLCYL